MKKLLLSLFSIGLTLITAKAQYAYQWSAHFGGSNTDYAYGIAVDNDGNVISGGEFREIIDFDPSEDGEALIESTFLNNAFVSKLNANGEYVWTHSIEGDSRVLDVHTDIAGNVYACGRFRETTDFLEGTGEWLLTSNGVWDSFLAKYTAAGDLVWAFSIGGVDQDFMNSIAIDDTGNLVVCGEFTNAVDFDPGAGEAELIEGSNAGTWDAFVAKYDSNGNYIWARQFGGELLQQAAGVSLTSEGDIVVAGHFAGLTDFDPGAGDLMFDNGSELDWQGYVVKLNEAGELIWGKSFGSIDHEWLYGMTVDEQDYVYVAGAFKGTADFDPGEGVFEMTSEGFVNDPYIVKLDTNGDFIWAGQFAGAGDGGCYAIDVVQGTIYTVGYATGTCDFDTGEGVATESSGALGYYGFVAVLDPLGQYLWSDRLGNGADDYGYAVVADETYLYVTGTFKGTSVWFGNTFYNSAGHDDIYVTKIEHPIIDKVVMNEKISITAYPNPASDFITVSGISGVTYILVSDVTGKTLMVEKVIDNSTLDLSKYAAGVYILTIRQGDETAHETIVLSR